LAASRGFAVAVLATICLLATGCGGGGSKSQPGKTPSTAEAVPTSTARVYLATAVGCELLGTGKAEGAVFQPLKVEASGYSATIQPIDGCRSQRIFFSYVYDIPVPQSGQVRITPGNQSVAVLDAAKLKRSGVATVFYVHSVTPGVHRRWDVTRIEYFKDEEVKSGP
jgi:hypothetical protein